MKKTILILILIIFCLKTFSQKYPGEEFTHHIITFEAPYQYISIDSSIQNIWQIGTPSKTFFNSSFSPIKAIVTDTVNIYPTNNHSFFDLYIGEFNYPFGFDYDIFIEIKHKFDTDTLKDGGYITVSYDNGQTWMNIINDTAYFCSVTPGAEGGNENLYTENDTLFNGEYGFSGKSNEWMSTWFAWHCLLVKNIMEIGDTMIIRFNFISDGIQNDKEGWMIDDIRLYSVDLGDGIDNVEKENNLFNVIPNPIITSAIINLNNIYKEIEINIYNINGELVENKKYYNSQLIQIERKNLKSGVYFFKIKVNNKFSETKKVIIE